MSQAEANDDIDETIIVRVSDYLDGALAGAERDEVARLIAEEPHYRRAHQELTETRSFLSGLRTAHAPAAFADGVTDTIHQRSAGRFFAKKTFGDRVPFGAVLVVALIGLAVIGYVLWSSATGSLKVEHERPPAASGSGLVTP